MSARLLVVATGYPQLGLLRFCKSEGLFVVGADANPSSAGAALCDAFEVCSTQDVDGIARAARTHRVDGLTTCGADHAVLPVAQAAQALGLPFYATPEVVRGCQHKDVMRERYLAGRAPSPAFEVIRALSGAVEFVAHHDLPVVVKPTRGWGQRGVRVVMKEAELAFAVREALEAAERATGHRVAVVEAFISGREFSVNAYTRDGTTEVLCVTERIITHYPDPPGITYAEAYPAAITPAEEAMLVDASTAGLRGLGVVRGPSYTQLRLGAEGAFLVETAHRLGGGLDPDVTLLASGVSLYRRIVGVALGRPAWESAGPEGALHGGAVGRFLVGTPGRVKQIDGLDAARATPHIVDAQVFVTPGDTVHPLVDGSKRVGHVLATGTDRADAERSAAAAMAAIHIVTEASS